MTTYFKNNGIKNNILSYDDDILQTFKDINNNVPLKQRGPYFKNNGIINKSLSFKNDLYNEIKKLSNVNNLIGVLSVNHGGTNISSYTIGDILYASGATTLSKLADVATGNVLISGGVGVAPSYGKVGLTTHVSGTLLSANGGTDNNTYTIGDILYASGATTLSKLADVATGNVIISGGVGVAPSYGKVNLTSSGHTTGTLPVGSGGTGQTSYTDGQLLIGNTTGNTLTKSSLTGTSNQIIVTPGSGSITLSTPQDIAITSSPQFQTLALVNTGGDCNLTMTATSNVGDTCNLTLTGNADVVLNLIADSDNISETDNPRINLIQDGGINTSYISMESTANTTMSGSLNNALLINNTQSDVDSICFGTAGTCRMIVGSSNNHCILPLKFPIVGYGLIFTEGTNAIMGIATLVAGTVTVSTTKVTTNSRIFLTTQTLSGTEYGTVRVSARSAATSFAITSYRGNNTTTVASGDTSNVAWMIVEPA